MSSSLLARFRPPAVVPGEGRTAFGPNRFPIPGGALRSRPYAQNLLARRSARRSSRCWRNVRAARGCVWGSGYGRRCCRLPFAFAGVWDTWKGPAGGWLQSFTIITTTPNELTRDVHNRMPVILKPEDYEEWLMRMDGEAPPTHLLRPYKAEERVAKEAHKDVGNVRKTTLNC
jgi:hypothetical protein